MLKVMLGILPPDEGEVSLMGVDLARGREEDRRRILDEDKTRKVKLLDSSDPLNKPVLGRCGNLLNTSYGQLSSTLNNAFTAD